MYLILDIRYLTVTAGMDLVDPKELESMRHQLEDAQRWNASLQARLAIQNRGGGVGGATDGGKTTNYSLDFTHCTQLPSNFLSCASSFLLSIFSVL